MFMKEYGVKQMYKYLIIIPTIFLLGIWGWNERQTNIISISAGNGVQVSFLDDIKDAITGHIDDVIDRQKEDKFIDGLIETSTTFTNVKDNIHWAKGSVEIIYKDGLRYIQLGSDFEAGLAPDLYIYTSPKILKNQADIDQNQKFNLTKLTKGSGASYYLITGDVKSIVIWCQRFNQFMGSANV